MAPKALTLQELMPSEIRRLKYYFEGLSPTLFDRSGGSCHLWLGPTIDEGYGVRQVTLSLKNGKSKPKNMLIHRLAYFSVHQDRYGFDHIPGFGISHLCGVKTCANPSHLIYEDMKTNVRRIPCHLEGQCNGHDGHRDCVFEDM